MNTLSQTLYEKYVLTSITHVYLFNAFQKPFELSDNNDK